MAVPEPGKSAPDFTLPTDGGGKVKLSEFKGRKVVLYFYPKDDTSGCTLEAVTFTTLAPEFAKAGTVVIGVSPDSVKSHDKFKLKHELGVILAADEDRKAIEAYGVWGEKSMYGRKYMGVLRTTFLIGPDRRIAEVWENVKVKGHAEAVLAAARAL
jgi:peroxiredoxin Q/BCP